MFVCVPLDTNSMVIGVLMLMSVSNNRVFVLLLARVKTQMEASNVSVHVATSWMRVELSVLTTMNVMLMEDVKRDAETVMDHTNVVVLKVSSSIFILINVLTKMNVLDQTTHVAAVNASTLLEVTHVDVLSNSLTYYDIIFRFKTCFFSGYQFDLRLSICIQSAGGCSNSPCNFGCNALGAQSFSCDCPAGYR